MGRQDEQIRRHFQDLDRSLFMEDHQEQASVDAAFPIGHGQTISQPSLVLQMTLALDPGPEDRVLEIGTGSGYQTALLAPFVREVCTVERIGELQEKARKRLKELGMDNVRYLEGDGSLGWPQMAPFDRIMVTAAASRIPDVLIEQLAPSGKMVIPVGPPSGQELLLVVKDRQGSISQSVITYVRFVPFVGEYQ